MLMLTLDCVSIKVVSNVLSIVVQKWGRSWIKAPVCTRVSVCCFNLVRDQERTCRSFFKFSGHKMSISRLFSVIGDANFRRNWTALNIASRESMKSAQIIDCVHLSTLDNALNEVRADSSVLVLASMTEFIVSSGDCGTIFSSVDPVLADVATKISGFCAFRPTLQVRLPRLAHYFPIRRVFRFSASLRIFIYNIVWDCIDFLGSMLETFTRLIKH